LDHAKADVRVLLEMSMSSDDLKQVFSAADKEQSVQSDEEIANALNIGEQYLIGTEFLNGSLSRSKDVERAVLYLTKSAELGHQAATLTLAWLYLRGAEVQRDLSKAREWATKLQAHPSNQFIESLFAAIEEAESANISDDEIHSVKVAPTSVKQATGDNDANGFLSSILIPAIFWVGVALFLYTCAEVDSYSPGGGRLLFVGVVGLVVVGIFINIIWGGSFLQMVKNLFQISKIAIFILIGLLVLGGVGNMAGLRGLSNTADPMDQLESVRKP
jgi:hypothetical protein